MIRIDCFYLEVNLHKIYQIDPLLCPKCQGAMRNIPLFTYDYTYSQLPPIDISDESEFNYLNLYG